MTGPGIFLTVLIVAGIAGASVAVGYAGALLTTRARRASSRRAIEARLGRAARDAAVIEALELLSTASNRKVWADRLSSTLASTTGMSAAAVILRSAGGDSMSLAGASVPLVIRNLDATIREPHGPSRRALAAGQPVTMSTGELPAWAAAAGFEAGAVFPILFHGASIGLAYALGKTWEQPSAGTTEAAFRLVTLAAVHYALAVPFAAPAITSAPPALATRPVAPATSPSLSHSSPQAPTRQAPPPPVRPTPSASPAPAVREPVGPQSAASSLRTALLRASAGRTATLQQSSAAASSASAAAPVAPADAAVAPATFAATEARNPVAAPSIPVSVARQGALPMEPAAEPPTPPSAPSTPIASPRSAPASAPTGSPAPTHVRAQAPAPVPVHVPAQAPASAPAPAERRRIDLPGVVVDPRTERCVIDGRAVALSKTEFDLLYVLASSGGEVVTTDRLVQSIWGGASTAPGSALDVTVHRVRKKLARAPGGAELVRTVRGRGYAISVPVPDRSVPDPDTRGQRGDPSPAVAD